MDPKSQFADYFAYMLFVTFPFIQSFGICVFKSSYDPLSNVSALDYLRIVSIN